MEKKYFQQEYIIMEYIKLLKIEGDGIANLITYNIKKIIIKNSNSFFNL